MYHLTIKSIIALGCAMLTPLPIADSAVAENPPRDGSNVSHTMQTSTAPYHLTYSVALLCQRASTRLHSFFGSTNVLVMPLTTIGEPRNSELGLIFATQLAAMLNNARVDDRSAAPDEAGLGTRILSGIGLIDNRPQSLHGTLQEVDGLLSIKLEAVNNHGNRYAQLFTLEMSESIYRSLHRPNPAGLR